MTSLLGRITWQSIQPPVELDPADLCQAVAAFVAELGYAGYPVSLLITDDATLRQLNRDYRGRDQVTDILAWSYLTLPLPTDSAPEQSAPVQKELLLGDLALSWDRAQVQAHENGWDLRTETLRLLAHGCAHLAGYDHESSEEEQQMRLVEERLLAGVGLRGLYPPLEA